MNYVNFNIETLQHDLGKILYNCFTLLLAYYSTNNNAKLGQEKTVPVFKLVLLTPTVFKQAQKLVKLYVDF